MVLKGTDVLGTDIEKDEEAEAAEEAAEAAEEAAEAAEEAAEEEEAEEDEHPDILACRPCGLVFAHASGLKDHQIRRCPVDAKRKDEGTYGYELECYLKDLPATVCCADQLPAAVENRTHSFVVNTDSCDQKGTHWVAFHFPKEGPAEFFDSFGRAPETYHRRFRNVLIANGPQYKFNTVRVQSENDDTCGLYCVHFVKYRYRNFTLEDIVNEFSARDPKTIEAELKDIYE